MSIENCVHDITDVIALIDLVLAQEELTDNDALHLLLGRGVLVILRAKTTLDYTPDKS